MKLIHKNGDWDVDNYRGITITPVLSKVYEKCYAARLITYLEEIEMFNNDQYGFLKAASTEDAAFKVINYLISNKNYYTASLFIDLKRAFETVNHTRLLAKLKQIGLSTSAVQLLHGFMRRRIVTDFNGHLSSPLEDRYRTRHNPRSIVVHLVYQRHF